VVIFSNPNPKSKIQNRVGRLRLYNVTRISVWVLDHTCLKYWISVGLMLYRNGPTLKRILFSWHFTNIVVSLSDRFRFNPVEIWTKQSRDISFCNRSRHNFGNDHQQNSTGPAELASQELKKMVYATGRSSTCNGNSKLKSTSPDAWSLPGTENSTFNGRNLNLRVVLRDFPKGWIDVTFCSTWLILFPSQDLGETAPFQS